MVKKLLSLLGAVAILSTMIVSTAFAAAPVFGGTGPVVPATYVPVTDTGAAGLSITYSLDVDSSVNFKITDLNSVEVYNATFDYLVADGTKTFSSWMGNYNSTSSTELIKIKGVLSSDFVLPGNYTVAITATNKATSEAAAPVVKTVAVSYSSGLSPDITSVSASATVNFNNDSYVVNYFVKNPSDILADIYYSNGQSFYEDDYGDTNTVSGDLALTWDGKFYTKCSAPTGNYSAVITSRNAYGISQVVKAFSTSTSYVPDTVCYSGSSKVTDIEFDPSVSASSAWDPIVDGDLSISWYINADNINEMTIQAIKGSTEFELPSDYSTDQGSDRLSPKWDGLDDDGEYIKPGLWKIVFLVTDDDNKVWYVEKTIKVQYTKPEIDDAFVTKTEIDPDLGEGTYFGFSLKDDANVDVQVIKGTSSTCGTGSSKVDLVLDQEVVANKWYAVFWDGNDEDGDALDYDETYSIKLTAESKGDDKAAACKTIKVDLNEDSVSSSKSNVINDYILPPVVSSSGRVDMNLHLDASATLSVGIYQGTSTGGSADYEILEPTIKAADDYSFTWNLKDSNGNVVRKGYYMYKITAQKSGSTSVETETGKFYVGTSGTIGEVYGEPTVVTPEPTPTTEDCGFYDVVSGSPYCASIAWGKENGIVAGNPNGSFGTYSPINRAEALKMVILASDLNLLADDGTNLGWSDVQLGAWYMSYLRTGKAYNMVAGYAGTTLVKPDTPVTRAEILKLAYQAEGGFVGTCSYTPYSDVSMSDWYAPYVCRAVADGIMDAYGDAFQPNTPATRGEVIEALYRLLK